MRLNVLGYQFRGFDGYGRYSAYLVRALRRAGVEITPHFNGAADAPAWLRDEWGVDFANTPTISCLPPFYLRKLPKNSAPHWLLTMTEGSELPDDWAEIINESGVERVLVPCQHNADAFRNGGVDVPITVVPGGTDPDEFPLLQRQRNEDAPYTFLTLADRGKRKGWFEVYNAFFMAFGTYKDVGPDKVRLIIKCRPNGNDLIDFILEKLPWIDPRITFLQEDYANIADFYALGDCLALPSRSEGWGMPHREAAMMGLPVITQAYSGMDDGHTGEWASVVKDGRMEPVEAQKDKHLKGQWRTVDREELAQVMRMHYENPAGFAGAGQGAAAWLRVNQTWDHACTKLLQVLQHEVSACAAPEGRSGRRIEAALEPEREYA